MHDTGSSTSAVLTSYQAERRKHEYIVDGMT